MALPQTNATLTAIHAQGFTQDGDLAETVGAAKWSGTSQAYVKERTLAVATGGRIDELKRTTLIVQGTLTPAVAILRGDTASYFYAGVTHTRRIKEYTARILPGMLHTVRIELEDE